MALFYIDQDSLGIAQQLRADGHQVTTAHERSLETAFDEEHLLLAVQHNEILITHNGKDFRMLHRAWLLWLRAWDVRPEHHGILVLEQIRPPERLAQEVNALLSTRPVLTNSLFQWRRSSGWERYQAR